MTCKKRYTGGIVLHGEEMESSFAESVCGVDKCGVFAKKLLSRWLIENSRVYKLGEKRIIGKRHEGRRKFNSTKDLRAIRQ